jgi:hypothetical protein
MKKAYDLYAEVVFDYDPETVDPFYWINDDGVKQWRMEGIYSDIADEDGIWEHLAYNAIFNAVEDASRLDGWADLDRGQLRMRVVGGFS